MIRPLLLCRSPETVGGTNGKANMLEPDSHLWPKDKTLIIKERSKVIQENSHQLVSIEIDEYVVTSAQRVGFFNIGSGRVLDKIPGSGSGSGRVGVSKNMIGYFRVPFLLSGISGYFGYFRVCRVFLGISGFTFTY